MYEQQIKKGAQKLTDYYGGENWKKEIIWINLDMLDPFMCIIGQLFKSYINGMVLLFELHQDFYLDHINYLGVKYGFTTYYDYTILTEEWRAYLASDMLYESKGEVENDSYCSGI